MATIQLRCEDELLNVVSCPTIGSGDILTLKAHFDLSPSWTNYTKTAVFFTNLDDTKYSSLIDNETGDCDVPSVVLEKKCTLFIGVYGVDDTKVKTSALVKVRIKEGAQPGEVPPDATPTLYQQLLAALNELKIVEVYNDTTTTQPEHFAMLNRYEYRYVGFTVTDSVTLDVPEFGIENACYYSILNVKTNFSTAMTAGNFVEFRVGGNLGVVVNPEFDITEFDQVQIVVYSDGTCVCCVVYGYGVTT